MTDRPDTSQTTELDRGINREAIRYALECLREALTSDHLTSYAEARIRVAIGQLEAVNV